MVYASVIPLILFQALLCVRDHVQQQQQAGDNRSSQKITVAGALSPLISLVFVLMVMSFSVALFTETPFEVRGSFELCYTMNIYIWDNYDYSIKISNIIPIYTNFITVTTAYTSVREGRVGCWISTLNTTWSKIKY